ncbi:lactate utilization protein [Fusobacterium ulcerans]|uniref:lactate utilization protein n=1 Tax=Fusobacterium ulcerans TaxID=861 RepID=UPI002672A37A|nr:lactate utilization protein [Fusobacterium ulcerans]
MNISQNMLNNILLNFEKRNMKGYFVEDIPQLIKLIKELVPENSIVGCGDSITLEEAGIYSIFRNGNFIFLDKYKENLTKEEKKELYIKNFSVNTFISGANAITEDGRIFNIDGSGSRVAPIIYGPKQVIIVVGINKIVPDLDHAVHRARQTAAPLDAVRLKKNTPCAKLGYCIDCRHPERICNSFVAIEGQFIKNRIKVIIIDKNMGF